MERGLIQSYSSEDKPNLFFDYDTTPNSTNARMVEINGKVKLKRKTTSVHDFWDYTSFRSKVLKTRQSTYVGHDVCGLKRF